MDGNGRWAKKQGLDRSDGHKAGVAVAHKIAQHCSAIGIRQLILYAFSSDNWQRPQQEVEVLMNLFRDYLRNDVKALLDKNIKISFIGDRTVLSTDLINSMCNVENYSQLHTGFHLIIAINYNGRNEIRAAANNYAKIAIIDRNALDDYRMFDKIMNSTDIIDPDLMIRTGGEMRLSGFLLWQIEYTELYFSQVLWPDFTTHNLDSAIDEFRKRERKRGMVM